MAPPNLMSQSASQGHGGSAPCGGKADYAIPSRGDIALLTLRKNFNGMSDVVDEDGLVRMWSNDMGKHIPVRPGGVALVVDVLPTPYDSHTSGHPVSVADVLMHSPAHGPVIVCTFVDRLTPISGGA